MKRKTFLMGVIALTVIALVLAAILISIKPTHEFAVQNAKLPAAQPAPEVRIQPVAPAPEPILQIAPDKTTSQPESVTVPGTSVVKKTVEIPAAQSVPQLVSPPASGKPPIEDPAARVALSFVGADPDAEEYWLGAINDATLSANERQDLIEDLNEDGLSDPKHPGLDDLPIILNRLQLLEEIADDAMDEVNAKAMLEAYKDLQNLAQVAMGGGKAVR